MNWFIIKPFALSFKAQKLSQMSLDKFRVGDRSSSHNGSECKSYCWSQSHSDIEISIKLTGIVKYEDVNVIISPSDIKVELLIPKQRSTFKQQQDQQSSDCSNCARLILIEGQFEHQITTESVYWLIDNDGPCIMIYLDKSENIWWKQLLLNEEVTESSPRNYTILMDHLDNGSRMCIDRLIVEQRNKRTDSENFYSYI